MYCYLSPIAADGRVLDKIILTNGEKDIKLLGWKRREKEKTGVFAELPPEESHEGRRPILYADIARQTCWYQRDGLPGAGENSPGGSRDPEAVPAGDLSPEAPRSQEAQNAYEEEKRR